MDLVCQTDARRSAVRSTAGRNGLDYVEVDDAERKLYVYFLGKLPPELAKNKPGLEDHLRIEGGDRITGLRIVDVDPQTDPDPERDDFLVVELDRCGDISPYTLRLVGIAGVDPRYATASFSFKLCCPTELDCREVCGCEPPALDEPHINYLAKDYGSFRQLIYDRLAELVPRWTERHVPDLGVTLVELLAYAGDYLSYYQDAVATEAYLATARQRISVRRHARLVDYRLHEGCNARAWVHLETSQDKPLALSTIGFITGFNNALPLQQSALTSDQLRDVPSSAYEYFEPVTEDPAASVVLRTARNEIQFYTWGGRACCLAAGATSATLLDHWLSADSSSPAADAKDTSTRALDIEPGDVLIFEEVLGAKTGVAADADPNHRWAVRVTRVQPTEDPLYLVGPGEGTHAKTRPTPLVEIEWAPEDALPFTLCIASIGAAPGCVYLSNVSVARGNVVLVDHGLTQDLDPLPPVPGSTGKACCDCEGHPSDVRAEPGRYRPPPLTKTPLTFCEPPPPASMPASGCLMQDVRAAVPALSLRDAGGTSWRIRADLLESGPDDRDVVVEIDNDGAAHLRFGDGELGRSPETGAVFSGAFRIGNGAKGNVGAEAISRLVLKDTRLDGVLITVRNPLPARGGTDPEPIAEAKLFAPAAFRKQIERAIIAGDYAEIAGRNARLQRAAAQLVWTGSWYEADVAVDPWNQESADEALLDALERDLYRYRRMGHDLSVRAARYVPLRLALEVCALPGYDRGHVRAALLDRFSDRRLGGGALGFFHPDALSFGDDVYVSRIVAAAQAVKGVECVTVTELHRCFEVPNRELQNGVLPLASCEIAQLDNDPDHPERGQLEITVRGGD